jgi:hypothetical protein
VKLPSFAFAVLTTAWVGLVGLCATQAQASQPIEMPQTVPGVPLSPTDEEGGNGKSNAGTPALLEFQGDPVDLVLRTLAGRAKINVVLSDQIAKTGGTVTMRIEDRTQKEAIDIIVMSKGFVMDELDGVYFIKTAAERGMEPVEQQLERLRRSMVGPLAECKGEYYRKLVEAGVPAATASDMVLREELTARVIEPQLQRGSKDQERRAEESSMRDDDDGLIRLPGLKDFQGWAMLGAVLVGTFGYIPLALLHLAFALAVFFAARREENRGEILAFFGPFVWACATLIGGVLAAALYWLMHHSAMSRRDQSA